MGTITPTPTAGQTWHSKAFKPHNDEGRVQVLGTVDTIEGIYVVARLVHGGNVSAMPIETFLRLREYRHS